MNCFLKFFVLINQGFVLRVDYVSSFRQERYLLLKCPVSVKFLRMRMTEDFIFACGILQACFSVYTILLGNIWTRRTETYLFDKCNDSFQKTVFEPID